MSTHPAPATGKISSVQRVSLSSLFSRSFRATSASASTIPPEIAPTSEPWTPWSWKHKPQPLKSVVFKWQSWLILVYMQSLTAPATRVRTSSQVVTTSCPLASFTIGWVRRCLFSPSYENLREGEPETGPVDKVWVCVNKEKMFSYFKSLSAHLVLSDIHSSLTSSFRRGIILMTSPPLVLTTMLEPTASSTSIDSVFLWTHQ